MGRDALKVGDVFTIKYVPEADPTGYFEFLKTEKFEVTEVLAGLIKLKIVVDKSA